jgi:NAD(P)-dependent dehydrogenase (short-subunit alcohol dehydrogenase family)
MKFGVLDISKSPEEQGYSRKSFDIILGLDVVHATRSIEETTENLKNLLAPNGVMLLIETVKRQRWIDMIWGLAEGWWYFEDAHIRRDSPLLSLDTWEKVLAKRGFKSVKAFPQRAAKRLETDFGLIVAQQQAEVMPQHAADWLTTRQHEVTPPIADKIRQVRDLEQLGAEVVVLSADVARAQDMEAVVHQARARFGDIHGIIHTAAIAGGGLMHLQTPALVQSEFAPKVGGTLVLEALCKQARLDFLVLCSSLSSITGGAGQVGYSAANAFLDAFAHYNTARHGTYTVSINWDRWQHVGLAVDVEARHRALQGDDADLEGMTPSEGVEAFRRILSRPELPQVVVSTQDFQTYLARARTARASHTLPALAQVRLATSGHPRPPLEQAYVAPRNEIEQRIADIWQEVFGIEPVGIYDNFFELGGESLIALQLLNRLRTVFQTEPSLRGFFEAPTVAGLSEAMAQVKDSSATVRAPTIVPLSREAHRSKRSM